MSHLANRPYLQYSPTVEKIPPYEAENIQAVAEMINEIQLAQWNMHRHCFSGTHARTHGIVKGTFEVLEDLPAHLQQGEIFKRGGIYPVAARYSTEPSDPGLDDRIPQPRGFAMKLFNVRGEFLEDGKDTPTQDFEFNSTPALDLADARTAKEIIGLRIEYFDNEPDLFRALEVRGDCPLQKARYGVWNTHLESTRQYSQTAFRFGDYIMKFALVPSSPLQKKLYEEHTKRSDGDDIFHRWLKDFHANNEAEYLFQVQLCENIHDQPVEYAGKVWDSMQYPFQTVAKVKFPKQNSWDYNRKTFWEDHMRVDPWHGLKAYRPLGSPNRLRKAVYPASSKLRRRMNGRAEIQIKSIEEIP